MKRTALKKSVQRIAADQRARAKIVTRRRRLRKRALHSMDKQLDALCREIVMRRDGGVCRWCGKGSDAVLQIHHIRTKGAHKELRWEISNLLLLCRGCHMFKAHSRDSEIPAQWYRANLPKGTLEHLEMLAQVRKGKKLDKAAVKLWLESQLTGGTP